MGAGHIKMTSQYGVHTLEIFRTSLEDSGTYRISAQNCKGEVSSFATLVVKRYIPGRKSLYPSKSFDDAKFYGATNFNDEDETKTIREHNFGYDIKKTQTGKAIVSSDRVQTTEISWKSLQRKVQSTWKA